jgi:hypothetical protein
MFRRRSFRPARGQRSRRGPPHRERPGHPQGRDAVEAPAVASVPASGAGQPAAVNATAKTAFGGMRAVGTAPAGTAGTYG